MLSTDSVQCPVLANDDIVNKSESEMDPTTNYQSLTYKTRNSEEMIDVENV